MAKKKKPAKKKTIAKKVVAKKIIAKKTKVKKRKTNRYNEIQRVLSAYGRDAGIKFGKDFTKIASKLNIHTKDTPPKYVAQNIEQLYKLHFEKPVIAREFPNGEDGNGFDYWFFCEFMSTAIFSTPLPDGSLVKVSYTFKDSMEEFFVEGNADEVCDYYKSGTHTHLRTYYSGSPPNDAKFKIIKTDNKTFVDYEIIHNEPQAETPIKPKEPITEPQPTGEGKPFTASEIIAIEEAKQRTMDKVERLMSQGWTKDEIKELLNLKK